MTAPADPREPYDVIGIGLATADLGLACPAEPVRERVRGDAHGSDPGTAPYRNAPIIRELLGREVHPADEPTAFQEFAV
ncbi:hypothetical protein [Streptomyces spectabilis]|uniref:Uncharacterized protein n=1 Tax=Streptomyces spectabilis TaxID=68270 RepID=A0A516R7S4_STRST|nr:hypothetical protein [Streptomyces spectabilis]QDQ11680.1 hypothetical protein FH965_14770 [Streptomyces spectabilis]